MKKKLTVEINRGTSRNKGYEGNDHDLLNAGHLLFSYLSPGFFLTKYPQ